jgi:hypothetical protein
MNNKKGGREETEKKRKREKKLRKSLFCIKNGNRAVNVN